MSDRWLTFNPVLSPVILFTAVVLSAIFFFWLERNRTLPYRIARYIALCFMILSVLAILLRPMYKSSKGNYAILLTAGYDAKKVDSLLNVYPDATILYTPETTPYPNATLVSTQHQISDSYIRFIVGEGLPAYALDLLTPGTYAYLPAPLPSGIVRIATGSSVVVKRKNYVEGIFHRARPGSGIYLEGPGGREDSVVLKGLKNEFFKLAFTPKQSGKFLYRLTDGQGVEEVLPVRVKNEKSMNILIVQHYPTFESQYLKKFLSARHRLLVRSQLSRNKYRYEFLNRKPQQITRLSKETLLDFDLLVIDSDAYLSLSSEETRQVQQAIDDGLGVLLSLNDSPANSKKLSSLFPAGFERYSADTATFVNVSKKITLPAWPLRPPGDPKIVPILKNKNRILSGYINKGLGKAGFQLLQQTYQLDLEGDSLSYSDLWSRVIGSLARAERKSFDLSTVTFPVFEDEPFRVEIISGGEVPSVLCDSVPVALSEDLFIDDVWNGKIWAGRPGWHTLAFRNDAATTDFYVSHKGEWKSLTIAQQIERTASHSGLPTELKQLGEVFKPIPEWIFYGIFLLTAAFLWLVPKL